MKNLFLVLLLISCSTKPDSKFKKLISQGKCEEASINIPDFKIQKASAHAQAIPGKGASYVLTSVAYGADIVIYVTSGIVLPVIICSPFIALDSSNGEIASACVQSFHAGFTEGKGMSNKNSFGHRTYQNTSNMRCPDFDFTVAHIMEVASCYEKNNEKSKALHQLYNLKDRKALGGCVQSKHLKDIEKRIAALEAKP